MAARRCCCISRADLLFSRRFCHFAPVSFGKTRGTCRFSLHFPKNYAILFTFFDFKPRNHKGFRMKILVINSGSSSLKFTLFDMEGGNNTVIATGLV